MSNSYFENLEKQHKREIENFTDGWNWNRIFSAWSNRIDDFPISIEPLFTAVCVHDPEYPVGRQNALSWWPAKRINELQIDFQRHMNSFPGTHGPVNPFGQLKGEFDTLDYLWEYKDDKEKIAAILINASLFTRLYSSRREYPKDNWPRYYCAKEIWKWAYKVWHDEKSFSPWQHYHTEVLPYLNWDYDYKISDINALIRFLAEEHALMLLNYKPVSIVFEDKVDPFIQKVLIEEYTKKQKLLEERQKILHKKESVNRNNQQRLQPKDNSLWRNISKDELERLVWTKPATTLAHEFGISDVAIAKRCKSLGISKPKPGFWAKVNAGVISHPKGKPIDID